MNRIIMKKYKYTLGVILLVLLATTGLEAQEKSITLSEAIEIGLDNNFQIRIAKKQVEVAKNNNTWKNTGRYPTVDFNLGFGNRFNWSNNPASFNPRISTFNSGLTPSIDGQWVLFDGFKYKINKKRLEELEYQTQSNVGLAIENNIRAIMVAYYQAVIQKKQLETLEEVLNLSKERIQYQQVRQEFGQAGKFEILQSSDAFLNDSTTLLIQKNTYENTLLNLKLSMGIDDMNITYEPKDKLDEDFVRYQFSDLEKKMFSKNKNLKQLYISQQLSKINTELLKADRSPVVGLGTGVALGGTGYWQSGSNPITNELYGADFSSNFNYYLNLNLTYNLFDAGARRRNVENAKIEEEIADLNIQDLKQGLSSQLRLTLDNYNNQIDLLRLTEKLIANARENMGISEARFRAGQISSFDYRTVQLAYVNASQARLNALYNLKNTEIELIRLTGGLVR